VKQLDKEPDIEAISLDNIDTTSQWRVEIQEPEMEVLMFYADIIVLCIS
jgi:hypothetical protein